MNADCFPSILPNSSGARAAETTAKRIKTDAILSEGDSPLVQAKSVDIPFDLWLMSEFLGCPLFEFSKHLRVNLAPPVGEHLEPLDLVHLTRANKSLRRLLRSKSDSARVWKLAFKNVNLPTLKATDWDLVHLASFVGEQRPCLGCGLVDGHRSWDRSVEREFATLIFVHWVRFSISRSEESLARVTLKNLT